MTVHLVTTLKRKATQILKEVNATKIPVLITQYGKPSAYIVDAESFHETNERIALLESIARGEQAFREGRIFTHEQVKKKLRKWLE